MFMFQLKRSKSKKYFFYLRIWKSLIFILSYEATVLLERRLLQEMKEHPIRKQITFNK